MAPYPPNFRVYLIRIEGKVRPYPLHTTLEVLISASTVSDTLDGSRYSIEPKAEQLTRNIHEERLSLRNSPNIKEKARREKEAVENAKPRFPVVKLLGFRPDPSPSRRFKLKNGETPQELSKRVWDLAKLEMVKVERRTLHHRYECSAWVMPWNKLQLSPPPNVMNLHPEEMISGDYRKLLYLKLQITSEDFLKFEGPIKVTIHNPGGADVSFTTEPYGAEEVRDCCHAFGLRLLSDIAYAPETYYRIVLLEGTETKKVLCLPDTCFAPPAAGKKVAVHVGKYQLADIDVTVGRSKGGYTEILEGMDTGYTVCLDHHKTYTGVRDAISTVKESLAADDRIKSRAAFSGSRR